MSLDPSSFFKNELLRPIGANIGPGVILTTAYWNVLRNASIKMDNILSANNETLEIIIFSVISLLVGALIENLGSLFEVHIIENWVLKNDKGIHEENWYNYLRLRNSEELIGHKYLRGILTRYKIELSLIPTIIFLIPAFLFFDHFSMRSFVISGIFLFPLAYCIWEAIGSQKVLRKIRLELLKGPLR
ncbi:MULTISPECIES: hypothetical protein [unclassified Leptospira]|uniref:hypothetical protein n=1 Tax=unclassified Leptospira TaxID=2633828 RepID=UPI0002BE9E20|nr:MULTISPECIES: hypothetical protein [unclassified Leptospira]EMJ99117.1 hypothetical protein LEP1GSC192_0486 [Leptospira sp. B5-022]MCR1795857.1 hypothetical protein [Leptospira sp. id769339]